MEKSLLCAYRRNIFSWCYLFYLVVIQVYWLSSWKIRFQTIGCNTIRQMAQLVMSSVVEFRYANLLFQHCWRWNSNWFSAIILPILQFINDNQFSWALPIVFLLQICPMWKRFICNNCSIVPENFNKLSLILCKFMQSIEVTVVNWSNASNTQKRPIIFSAQFINWNFHFYSIQIDSLRYY